MERLIIPITFTLATFGTGLFYALAQLASLLTPMIGG